MRQCNHGSIFNKATGKEIDRTRADRFFQVTASVLREQSAVMEIQMATMLTITTMRLVMEMKESLLVGELELVVDYMDTVKEKH